MSSRILSLAAVCLFTLNAFADHNPVGEKAHYKLDLNPKRTSSMIKSGTVDLNGSAFHESTPFGPAYEIQFDYLFKVTFMGTYKGTDNRMLEKKFFTDAFLEDLRKNGSYEGEYFKAKHLGYEDVKTLDGSKYSHTDKVFLYDLKDPGTFSFFTDMLAMALGQERPEIENPEVTVRLVKGVPVIGAVQVDLTGVSQGMRVKAGGDYMKMD